MSHRDDRGPDPPRPSVVPLARGSLSGQLAPIHREAIIPGVPSVLVYELGHEQSGIPPEAIELLDVAVEIPMIGIGAGLNDAVAGSLVLYRLAGFL